MKRTILKSTVIAMAIFFTAGLAYSQPPRGKSMPMGKPAFAMKQNMLNLTDDQKDQMKQLFLDKTKEVLPLRNEMAVLKAEYRQLITAEKADQKRINANIDKQTALMNKMKKVHAKYTLKMRDILTEEQWLIMQSHRGMRGMGGMKGAPGAGFHRGAPGAGPCGMGYGPGKKAGMGPHPGMMMRFSDDDN